MTQWTNIISTSTVISTEASQSICLHLLHNPPLHSVGLQALCIASNTVYRPNIITSEDNNTLQTWGSGAHRKEVVQRLNSYSWRQEFWEQFLTQSSCKASKVWCFHGAFCFLDSQWSPISTTMLAVARCPHFKSLKMHTFSARVLLHLRDLLTMSLHSLCARNHLDNRPKDLDHRESQHPQGVAAKPQTWFSSLRANNFSSLWTN